MNDYDETLNNWEPQEYTLAYKCRQCGAEFSFGSLDEKINGNDLHNLVADAVQSKRYQTTAHICGMWRIGIADLIGVDAKSGVSDER